MIRAASFLEHLRTLGYSHYAGVPCSFLKPFINYVIDDPSLDYVGATSEGEAVGISLGAFLAGRKTVTLCQNSGLGNMVNPLTSLNYPFRVPTLLITTWRGQPGIKDEPQHEQMGRILPGILQTLEIPWLPFPTEASDIPNAMREAELSMAKLQRPFALVMSQDSVADHTLSRQPASFPHHAAPIEYLSAHPHERLTRTEALQLLLDILPSNAALVATTGKTGRELFTIADRPNHLYVVGGMGTASAIGLGIAHALPQQSVVVIDGDGAALMKLGNLATIGFYQPENLLHIVLDNEAHDSTGGQQTSSSITRFATAATAANYRHAIAVDRPEDIRAALHTLRRHPGPALLHIKIRTGSPEKLGRPTVKPHEVKERFMAFLRNAPTPAPPHPLPSSPLSVPAFLKPEPLLFTPGPLTTSHSVKQAMLRDLGSRDRDFIRLVRNIQDQLLALAGVSRQAGYETVLMQGSGTFAIESVLSSVIPRDGKLLVLSNGAYGERLFQIANRHAIPAMALRSPENQHHDLSPVDQTLHQDPTLTHVAVVHSETSSGIVNPIEELGALVARHHRTFVVDAMSSFGALPLSLTNARIDFLVSSANKCIEGVPGFAFVLARREPLQRSEGLARTLSLDLVDQWRGLETSGQFRFTPPTHALLAFDQALKELHQEGGPAARLARYQANHHTLLQGMKTLGFIPYLPESLQSPIITSFLYPDYPQFQFESFYEQLADRGFVLYPGKLTRVNAFRIGTIGRLYPKDILALLHAIRGVLQNLGCPVPAA